MLETRRTENFEYRAMNLETGIVITCADSLSPILSAIRKDVKIMHGNKIRSEILEHGVYYVEEYGRHNRNKHIYYPWAIWIHRW